MAQLFFIFSLSSNFWPIFLKLAKVTFKACSEMEELPEKVMLLMLAHIDPLCDMVAVSGTCRKWRHLMLDSYTHLHSFPQCGVCMCGVCNVCGVLCVVCC